MKPRGRKLINAINIFTPKRDDVVQSNVAGHRENQSEWFEGAIEVRHYRNSALLALVHNEHEARVADTLTRVLSHVETWHRQRFYTAK
jgi:hypothetical protein